MLDNAKMAQLSMQYLNAIDTMSEKNEIISKVVSSFTNPLRFADLDMSDTACRLIWMPRLHFISCSMAPLIPHQTVNKRQLLIDGYMRSILPNSNVGAADICNVIQECSFDAELKMKNTSELNQLGDYMTDGQHYLHPSVDYDRTLHLNMMTGFHFHGNVKEKEAMRMTALLRHDHKYEIIESLPCVARCSFSNRVIPQTKNGIVRMQDPMAFLFANNSAFGGVIEKGVCEKYEQLEQKANAKYRYLQHGLEHDGFLEAVEDVACLVKQYADDEDYDEED